MRWGRGGWTYCRVDGDELFKNEEMSEIMHRGAIKRSRERERERDEEEREEEEEEVEMQQREKR